MQGIEVLIYFKHEIKKNFSDDFNKRLFKTYSKWS